MPEKIHLKNCFFNTHRLIFIFLCFNNLKFSLFDYFRKIGIHFGVNVSKPFFKSRSLFSDLSFKNIANLVYCAVHISFSYLGSENHAFMVNGNFYNMVVLLNRQSNLSGSGFSEKFRKPRKFFLHIVFKPRCNVNFSSCCCDFHKISSLFVICINRISEL